MTLHAAKGLEFDTVFLPGWEEGLFPSQRTMDESGLAGPRRGAPPRLCRPHARAQAHPHILRRQPPRARNVQSALPSRFITELPPDHVEAVVDEGFYGGSVGFRDNASGQEFASTYDSPGWKRAQANRAASGGLPHPPALDRRRTPQAHTVQTSDPSATQFARGERVFHQKFGYGRVSAVEGNKLTVDFDKAGEKKVIDQFVQRA